MARKKKKVQSQLVVLTHEEWLASWTPRVSYTPPAAIKRGQVARRITIKEFGNVMADPTRFTAIGPSKKTLKRRHSRAARGR